MYIYDASKLFTNENRKNQPMDQSGSRIPHQSRLHFHFTASSPDPWLQFSSPLQ